MNRDESIMSKRKSNAATLVKNPPQTMEDTCTMDVHPMSGRGFGGTPTLVFITPVGGISPLTSCVVKPAGKLPNWKRSAFFCTYVATRPRTMISVDKIAFFVNDAGGVHRESGRGSS